MNNLFRKSVSLFLTAGMMVSMWVPGGLTASANTVPNPNASLTAGKDTASASNPADAALDKTASIVTADSGTADVTLTAKSAGQNVKTDVVLVLDQTGSMNDYTNDIVGYTDYDGLPVLTTRRMAPAKGGDYQCPVYENGAIAGYANCFRKDPAFEVTVWHGIFPEITYPESAYRINLYPDSKGDHTHAVYSTTTKLQAVAASAKKFIGNILPSGNSKVNVSVVTFNETATAIQPFTPTASVADAAIDHSYTSGEGNTNIAAGISQADSMLKPAAADNKIMVLFTDGEPNTGSRNPAQSARNAAAAAKGNQELVFTVGCGLSHDGADLLTDISSGDGYHFLVSGANDISTAFNRIANVIQYPQTGKVVTDTVGDAFTLAKGQIDSSYVAIKDIHGKSSGYYCKVAPADSDVRFTDAGNRVIQWTIGKVSNKNGASLSYRVQLKTADSLVTGSVLYTNNSATYKNPSGTYYFPKPYLKVVGQGVVSFTGALVNRDGKPIDSNGAVVSKASLAQPVAIPVGSSAVSCDIGPHNTVTIPNASDTASFVLAGYFASSSDAAATAGSQANVSLTLAHQTASLTGAYKMNAGIPVYFKCDDKTDLVSAGYSISGLFVGDLFDANGLSSHVTVPTYYTADFSHVSYQVNGGTRPLVNGKWTVPYAFGSSKLIINCTRQQGKANILCYRVKSDDPGKYIDANGNETTPGNALFYTQPVSGSIQVPVGDRLTVNFAPADGNASAILAANPAYQLAGTEKSFQSALVTDTATLNSVAVKFTQSAAPVKISFVDSADSNVSVRDPVTVSASGKFVGDEWNSTLPAVVCKGTVRYEYAGDKTLPKDHDGNYLLSGKYAGSEQNLTIPYAKVESGAVLYQFYDTTNKKQIGEYKVSGTHYVGQDIEAYVIKSHLPETNDGAASQYTYTGSFSDGSKTVTSGTIGGYQYQASTTVFQIYYTQDQGRENVVYYRSDKDGNPVNSDGTAAAGKEAAKIGDGDPVMNVPVNSSLPVVIGSGSVTLSKDGHTYTLLASIGNPQQSYSVTPDQKVTEDGNHKVNDITVYIPYREAAGNAGYVFRDDTNGKPFTPDGISADTAAHYVGDAIGSFSVPEHPTQTVNGLVYHYRYTGTFNDGTADHSEAYTISGYTYAESPIAFTMHYTQDQGTVSVVYYRSDKNGNPIRSNGSPADDKEAARVGSGADIQNVPVGTSGTVSIDKDHLVYSGAGGKSYTLLAGINNPGQDSYLFTTDGVLTENSDYIADGLTLYIPFMEQAGFTIGYVNSKDQNSVIHPVDAGIVTSVSGFVSESYDGIAIPYTITDSNGSVYTYNNGRDQYIPAGTLSESSENVVLPYTKNVTVTVNYVDEIHGTVLDTKAVTGLQEAPYSIPDPTASKVAGFARDDAKSAKDGTFGSSDSIVTVNYLRGVTVTVNYVDSADNTIILDAEKVSGLEGRKYQVPSADSSKVSGYTVDPSAPAEGTFGPADQTITVLCSKIIHIDPPVPPLTTMVGYTVHYYLEGTKTSVAGDLTSQNVLGSKVTASPAGISGYTAVSQASKTITLGESGNEIVFYYTKNVTIVVPGVPSAANPNTGSGSSLPAMALLLGGISAAAAKIIKRKRK